MRPRIKREPHLPGETAVQYEERLTGIFSQMGDMLLKRYIKDFIHRNKESSFSSFFKKRGFKNEKLTIKGKGTFYDEA